jgi:hypothetical protein
MMCAILRVYQASFKIALEGLSLNPEEKNVSWYSYNIYW